MESRIDNLSGLDKEIRRSGKATIDNEGDSEYNSHREWAKDGLSSEDQKIFYEKIGEIKRYNRKATFSDDKYLLEINNKWRLQRSVNRNSYRF